MVKSYFHIFLLVAFLVAGVQGNKLERRDLLLPSFIYNTYIFFGGELSYILSYSSILWLVTYKSLVINNMREVVMFDI